ncbi:Ribose-5-phosphate isomerase B [Mesoplasma sp. JKS002658]|uniref:RpiB/LacA/LacB family sugar-phosphate isomerase n=1 Tax=Mesoplasma whartonense TaxID=2878854 RepID=UPI0020229D35|nr:MULTISPECIES: RpiB/LacA/LacB family sugar-phosphate isomerase [unclassified Mesoplasma]MCL8211733.1 Ribose-5-phosphate isomerase B [Mesoplasma sp. JKS002664]MCL8212110.1 Ribose-5-phosphate isomerase B [Mesoplasma sp. JKS002662]MCL8212733.1 Ribose-5-phosphate isomerase B [Mesoplasma sp. JKS002661]MCL8213653.1 Ribose-5-phosphate isomerase B [Mesoplasma sp. JKS002660]MCL8213785.1 Ribose-5-phosphate isomerase B [Mesoplasma sp. JKS002658]
MKPRIYISNDHTGVEMKQAIVKYLTSLDYQVTDLGNVDGKSCSYASKGLELGEKIAGDKDCLGVALCGTGIGISIAANKVKGVRAGLVSELETAQLIREHNDCNVIAMGARMIAVDKALKLVDAFLKSEFAHGRHEERVKTINEYHG